MGKSANSKERMLTCYILSENTDFKYYKLITTFLKFSKTNMMRIWSPYNEIIRIRFRKGGQKFLDIEYSTNL